MKENACLSTGRIDCRIVNIKKEFLALNSVEKGKSTFSVVLHYMKIRLSNRVYIPIGHQEKNN